MTLFQMHFGRKPRTAITKLIGQPECLLSNWKKKLTNYISAQPTELQMFTMNDSEGEMADYSPQRLEEKGKIGKPGI